ncbi:MAG: hypothetical protein A2Y15_01360 [Clostridiales bacterium GWF2_36_10]|nr:MAG: hypothetical protein A2Y15_01360 [Clostridiales bacterium GWF2_36_10]HAN22049.1 hypothetical protein [Clostridiales bacterium]
MTTNEKILNDLRLSKKRYLHTMGVVACTKELAKRHFPLLSTEKLETAALLHDFTKELSVEEQKALCQKYNIAITAEDEKIPKLFHGKTAAAIAIHEYSADEETASAIYYHTTGRANMTDMETVLFFADYIEDYRTDKACIDVRKYYEKCLKQEDKHLIALKKGVLYSFDTTIKHILDKKELISYTTIEARNSLLEDL